MNNPLSDAHIHDGHRARMRSKCLEHGSSIFDSYELLEMLLYYVIPYKDTNPIAKRLIARFGSIDGVFGASADELMEVSGIGARAAEFLLQVGRVPENLGIDPSCADASDFSDFHKTGGYFAELLGEKDTHSVLAMYLDNNMRLIDVEKVFDVDFESAAVRSMPIIDSALRNHASIVITAHNHPTGPLFISEGDNQTNNMLTDALAMVSVMHLEHFLVCGRYYVGALHSRMSAFRQYAGVLKFLEGKASSSDGYIGKEDS